MILINYFLFFFVLSSLIPAIIKVALAGMDREMREDYLVVIQAKDMGGHMGGLSGTTTVTVTLTDINDNPPKFSKGNNNRLLCLVCESIKTVHFVLNIMVLCLRLIRVHDL